MRNPPPPRVVDRLLANVEPGEGGCIISLYSVGSHGYSQIGWTTGGVTTMQLGHRVAWYAEHGDIPEDMTVDHTCRVRRCVNAAHLRLLTNIENAKDNGMSRRTHCPSGHPYSDENTYVDPKGHRRCRKCAIQ